MEAATRELLAAAIAVDEGCGTDFWGKRGGKGVDAATCDAPLDAVLAIRRALFAVDVATHGKAAAIRRRAKRRAKAAATTKKLDAEWKRIEREEERRWKKRKLAQARERRAWLAKHPEASARQKIRELLRDIDDVDVLAALLQRVKHATETAHREP